MAENGVNYAPPASAVCPCRLRPLLRGTVGKTSLARKLHQLGKTRTYGHPQNGALDQARPFMASPESTAARWGLPPCGQGTPSSCRRQTFSGHESPTPRG